MAYATLADLKAYLRIASGVTTDDALLTDFLDEASGIIKEYVGHPLESTAHSNQYFDAVLDVDGQLLTFDGAYAASINAVENGDGEIIASTEYVTEPRNRGPFYGIRLKSDSNYVWTFNDSPEGAIRVSAHWCYSENTNGTVDALVSGATLQLAAWLYRSKDQVAELSRPVQTADGITVLPLALPRSVMDRLSARRRLV